MRHRTPRARGQPLRAVCPRNVVRLFRPLGRNWTTRINSGRPTVRLPQAEAWAERERVPSGHNCRRQLATGRPEQIQEPGTAVPGTPIFANNAQRGGPPLESPCRWLSLVLSFASKESTTLFGAAAPPLAPESARQAPSFTANFSLCGAYLRAHRGFPPLPALFHSKHVIKLQTCFHTSCNASRPTHKTSQNFLPLSNQKSREPHVFHGTPCFLFYPRQG